MLSRVAENLYWISRYAERAEGLARLLEDAYSMELETGSHEKTTGPLDNVLLILNGHDKFTRFWEETKPSPNETDERPLIERREAILRFLIFGRKNGVSIRETVARARESARGTQEAVSGEAWSQLNKLYLYLISPQADARFMASPSRFLERIRRECVLFTALVDGTLPRTEEYHFLQVGRYIERVDMLSRVLNVHCHASDAFIATPGTEGEVTFSSAHWASLLRGTSSYEAYLKQACERVDPLGVVQYLLMEADFPRSIRFGVARCLESLRCIAGGSGTDAERHFGKLDSELRYMNVEELFQRGIDSFLVSVQDTCAAVGKDVHTAYFRT